MLKTRIPLKDQHVRQFVMARYGNNSATVEITKRSLLGTLAVLACEKVGYRHILPKTEVPSEKDMITLILPDSLRNHFIHPAKLQAIAHLLTHLFNQAFLEALEALEASVRLGVSDYDAVSDFMDRYGLTEDMISPDTLRKKWRDHQRYMGKKTTRMLTLS